MGIEGTVTPRRAGSQVLFELPGLRREDWASPRKATQCPSIFLDRARRSTGVGLGLNELGSESFGSELGHPKPSLFERARGPASAGLGLNELANESFGSIPIARSIPKRKVTAWTRAVGQGVVTSLIAVVVLAVVARTWSSLRGFVRSLRALRWRPRRSNPPAATGSGPTTYRRSMSGTLPAMSGTLTYRKMSASETASAYSPPLTKLPGTYTYSTDPVPYRSQAGGWPFQTMVSEVLHPGMPDPARTPDE